MPRRSAPPSRWFVAAFLGALALPAIILLAVGIAGEADAGTLLAARAAGAVAFSLLAVVVWLAVVRPRR